MTSILLNKIYTHNIEDKIKLLEETQALNSGNKAQYITQFDDLKFDDNKTEPKDLENLRYYSNFKPLDDTEEFELLKHSNMIPYTSRRDYTINNDNCNRKLQTFTGVFENYQKKTEKTPLFEPMADLSWVHGIPSYTSALQNRYYTSNKNNKGNLPFEYNVKVKPGINNQVQQGIYSVYRIEPQTVDNLRSDINKKISYNNKPLESIKKGEIRADNFNLTKYKLPDFREQKFGDLIPNNYHVGAPQNTGLFTNIDTQRNNNENYYVTPANNTSQGNGPSLNKTQFEPSSKINFKNDNTHAITQINNKPVMTNINSYIKYINQRDSTNYENTRNINNSTNVANYTIDYSDTPLITLKELNIINDFTGVISSQEKQNYVFSNDMILPINNRQTTKNFDITGISPELKKVTTINFNDKAKPTIKQDTSHNIITNFISPNNNVYANVTDEAKPTIKQDTSHNIITNFISQNNNVYTNVTDEAKPTTKQDTSHNIISNIIYQYKKNYSNLTDEAKSTIRPEISHNIITNHTSQNKNIYSNITDDAKTTIRQQTELTDYIGNVNNNNNSINYVRDKNDKAKTTIREQIELTDYLGNVTTNIKNNISHDASDNMTIDERREISTFNRISNGCRDLNGPYINKETVQLVEPILYSYIAGPRLNLDSTITPPIQRHTRNFSLNDENEIINNNNNNNSIYKSDNNYDIIRCKDSRNVYDSSNYYINNNFINTLNDNPYFQNIIGKN
jgi:hypothetical protein